MNSLDTVLFPDTDIFKDNTYPLLLPCAPLYFLQPVEPEPGLSSEPDLFMKSGLCQALTPPPLGGHRARFLRLIHDIRTRKDDYGAQLSALTMAAMSAPKSEKSGERHHEIVSSLLKKSGVDPTAFDRDEIKRWQARLVLSIAEILDREETELTQNLQLLDEHELALFSSLQGHEPPEDDNPFVELERIKTKLSRPRSREAQLRVRSWLTLMRSISIPPTASLWCATSRDSADQLFLEYEKRTDIPALPILRLTLPASIAASPPYLIEQIKSFHREAADVLQMMAADLTRLQHMPYQLHTDAKDLPPGDNDYITAWNSLVDRHFPSSSHGKMSLLIYLLHNLNIPELFALPSEVTENGANGLLAVLQHDS